MSLSDNASCKLSSSHKFLGLTQIKSGKGVSFPKSRIRRNKENSAERSVGYYVTADVIFYSVNRRFWEKIFRQKECVLLIFAYICHAIDIIHLLYFATLRQVIFLVWQTPGKHFVAQSFIWIVNLLCCGIKVHLITNS